MSPRIIHITNGDIFASGCHYLVNPCNTVGVSGAGLSREFANRIPGFADVFRRICAEGKVGVGKVYITHFEYNPRPITVIHLATKRHWRNPSVVADVRASLQSMVWALNRYPVSSVAVPALGCGLGGLSWAVVEPMMREELGKLNHGWTVELYLPKK